MIDQPVILQRQLAARPWESELTARLPGLTPVAEGDWLIRDDAFAAQMQLRDRLFTDHPDEVFDALPGSGAAQRELLDLVVRDCLASGAYELQDGHLIRPDQIAVDALTRPAIVAAARLVQEDLLILQKQDGKHVLTAAALAFPAAWTLSEKIGRPMAAIHAPVARIDELMDARIERLFDRLPGDQPVQRSNVLAYNDPALHHPRPESAPRQFDPDLPIYIRVERQTLRRLPASSAIVFAIHTSIVPLDRLTITDVQACLAHLESIGRAAHKD